MEVNSDAEEEFYCTCTIFTIQVYAMWSFQTKLKHPSTVILDMQPSKLKLASNLSMHVNMAYCNLSDIL